MVILYKGSPLGSWLLMNQGWDDPSILLLEKFLIPGVGITMILFIQTPNLVRAITFSAIIMTYALLELVNGGKPMVFWGFLAHLSKVIMPFLLYFLFTGKMAGLSGTLFKGAIALIFIAHGMAAVLQHPMYIDYLISFGHTLSGEYLSEKWAGQILTFIGCIDIAGGVAILFFKHIYLLGWLIFWGFITAIWRIFDTSLWNIDAFLIRSPHFLLPIAYYFWLNKASTSTNSG